MAAQNKPVGMVLTNQVKNPGPEGQAFSIGFCLLADFSNQTRRLLQLLNLL